MTAPPLPSRNLVIACVEDHPKAMILLRIARRRAQEKNCRWRAVYIETPTHYAPRTPLVLTSDAQNVQAEGKTIGRLILSTDLHEAAASLFRRLRELDDSGCELIVAQEVAEEGLGRAIMDRLRRAAAR